MIKSVATGTLITYVMILFGYGVASAGHELLHDIKNPFHTHGQVNEHDHRHEDDHQEDNDHHKHNAPQNQEDHHADNNHDYVETVAIKSHDIEDHTNGFDKLNGQDQDVSPTETLNPLFIFVYAQSNSIIESTTSNFKLSETEHHYLSLYKSLGTEPITPPPSVLG
ncbi:hypothetical protein [Roseivirga echinicomitans]|uniref:Uncharacterized protein n=1 Tax=Roseivirga echinicomitans TaxID=296218 RepID=A0A150XX21_9BACT|nr:hypothetical protein [Roseivirga echinicomitans]KYG83248.1 hypothetical protein AWN68_00085 [Roseivirga echinicomitans]